MRPLAKEAETKLIGAIERAAGYVNSGMSPDDAIVKSASESDIPAGHINLMVHAYNTGRTTKQREQGDDTLEKAADFPLADAQVVLDALFPRNVKTAAALVAESIVSPQYALPPHDLIARRNSAMTKAAAGKISLPEKTWTPPPRDEEAVVRKAASARRAAELASEELRRQATAAYAKAAGAMETLQEYFRHPGNMSFQDAVRQTELRFGEPGVSVLKKLAAVYPYLEKQAATQEMWIGNGEPFTLVKNVLDAVHAYNTAKIAVPVKEAKHKKEVPVFLTDSILHNPADEPLTLKSAAGTPPAPAPAGGFFQPAINAAKHLAGAGNSIATGLGDDYAKTLQSLTDPEHDNELRNIRAQGVLHDMMINDSVISGHDPYDVANAFNELANVAPGFVDSPAAMQALMRKRLEAGHMADFDVKQIVDMEKAKAEAEKARVDTMRTQRDLMQ